MYLIGKHRIMRVVALKDGLNRHPTGRLRTGAKNAKTKTENLY
jgi:hypothetical protein